MWVLRDFQLELSKDGRPISEGQYLHEFLRDDNTTTELNKVKAQLCDFFDKRELSTLPHPGKDDLSKTKHSDLSENFKLKLESLSKNIGKLVSKGKKYTCRMTVNLIAKGVELINRGEIVRLDTLWNDVMHAEEEKAWQSTMILTKSTEKDLNAKMPFETEALLGLLSTLHKDSVDHFNSHFCFEADVLKRKNEMLVDYFSELQKMLCALN